MNLILRVGVKILVRNKKGQYLVLARSENKYPGAGGQWDIPGGRINPGASLFENLKREVLEETGLALKGEPRLLAAQDILKEDHHTVRLTYVGQAEEGEIRLSEEHTDYRWLSVPQILGLDPLDRYLKEVLTNFDLK